MKSPTNHELHTMLKIADTKLDNIIKTLEDYKGWLDSHEKKDSERFTALHQRIDGFNRFGMSISIVSAAVGAGITWFFSIFKGVDLK